MKGTGININRGSKQRAQGQEGVSAQQIVQAGKAISQDYPSSSWLVIDVKGRLKGSHPR